MVLRQIFKIFIQLSFVVLTSGVYGSSDDEQDWQVVERRKHNNSYKWKTDKPKYKKKYAPTININAEKEEIWKICDKKMTNASEYLNKFRDIYHQLIKQKNYDSNAMQEWYCSLNYSIKNVGTRNWEPDQKDKQKCYLALVRLNAARFCGALGEELLQFRYLSSAINTINSLDKGHVLDVFSSGKGFVRDYFYKGALNEMIKAAKKSNKKGYIELTNKAISDSCINEFRKRTLRDRLYERPTRLNRFNRHYENIIL